LKSVTWSKNRQNHSVTYDYYRNGSIKKVTYSNGIYEIYTYDWDKGGILKSKIVRNSQGETILAFGFNYNEFGELVREGTIMPDFPQPDKQTQSGTVNYVYDDYNHLLKAGNITVTWNDNGEMKTYGQYTYDFDKSGNLTKVTENGAVKFYYIYDGQGSRILAARQGKVSRYIYGAGGNELQEVIFNGPTYDYIWASGLVARTDQDGNTHFYLTDLRGNVVAITDQNGNITHQYKYDEYGNLINVREPDGDFNPYRFLGAYGITYEDENLYYVHARYYNPQLGIFLSEDPIWNINLYTYAGANPVMNIDPTGELSLFKAGLFGMVTNGIIEAFSSFRYAINSFGSVYQGIKAISQGDLHMANIYLSKADNQIWTAVKNLSFSMIDGFIGGVLTEKIPVFNRFDNFISKIETRIFGKTWGIGLIDARTAKGKFFKGLINAKLNIDLYTITKKLIKFFFSPQPTGLDILIPTPDYINIDPSDKSYKKIIV